MSLERQPRKNYPSVPWIPIALIAGIHFSIQYEQLPLLRRLIVCAVGIVAGVACAALGEVFNSNDGKRIKAIFAALFGAGGWLIVVFFTGFAVAGIISGLVR